MSLDSLLPFDAFHIAIAKHVRAAPTLGHAHAGLDYGKKSVNFTIALPMFRLPGKTDELAGKVTSVPSYVESFALPCLQGYF